MSRFNWILTTAVLAAVIAPQQWLFAQEASGGNARGANAGPGRGGFPGGGFPGGGFGGPGGGFGRRGFGGRGFGGGFPGGGFGGDPLGGVNPADLVHRIDTNRDGVIETSEMNDRLRPLLQRAGLKTDEPISNDRAIAAFEKLKNQNPAGGRFPGGGDDDFGYSAGSSSSAQTSKSSTKQESSTPALVQAFGESTDLPPVPGFGESLVATTPSFGSDTSSAAASAGGSSGNTSNSGPATSSSSSTSAGSGAPEDAKIRSYAASMLKRYDKNNDGTLDKSEWSQMSGDPEKYDRNHDGKITLDELVDSLKNWNRPSEDSTATPSKAASAAAATGTSAGRSASAGSNTSTSDAAGAPAGRSAGLSVRRGIPVDDGKHYRSPKDRLPEGLPEWFTQADSDGDGQISMHEYAEPLTDEKLAEFAKYDLNNDGFITPSEVLKVSPPKK
ncbi:MAG TPA: EF-hand domain-containing protein [Pirellulales bacterium]|jgi:Ca2+-binding EF-hand superfamily protein